MPTPEQIIETLDKINAKISRRSSNSLLPGEEVQEILNSMINLYPEKSELFNQALSDDLTTVEPSRFERLVSSFKKECLNSLKNDPEGKKYISDKFENLFKTHFLTNIQQATKKNSKATLP